MLSFFLKNEIKGKRKYARRFYKLTVNDRCAKTPSTESTWAKMLAVAADTIYIFFSFLSRFNHVQIGSTILSHPHYASTTSHRAFIT